VEITGKKRFATTATTTSIERNIRRNSKGFIGSFVGGSSSRLLRVVCC